MLTRQEILNIAYLGLKTQGCKSEKKIGQIYETKICAYRGIDNTKCTIGMLIHDEDYTPEMDNIEKYPDGTTVSNLYYNHLLPSYLKEFAKADVKNINFLINLQSAHDRCTDFKHDLYNRFKEVAINYGLKMPD